MNLKDGKGCIVWVFLKLLTVLFQDLIINQANIGFVINPYLRYSSHESSNLKK